MLDLIRKVIRLKIQSIKESYRNKRADIRFRTTVRLHGMLNAISQEIQAQRTRLDVEQGYYTLVDKYNDGELALRELEAQNRTLNRKINDLGTVVSQLTGELMEIKNAKQN